MDKKQSEQVGIRYFIHDYSICRQNIVFLDDKKIGTTELEKADAPMGIVFGNIKFYKIPSGYDFFKSYSLGNGIEVIFDDPEERLISTADIPNLKVINPDGSEITAQAINVEGMDSDNFMVTIWGIPYPFFEKEFPHHVKAYMN